MTFAVHAPTDDDIKDESMHGHLHGHDLHDLPPPLEKKHSDDNSGVRAPGRGF